MTFGESLRYRWRYLPRGGLTAYPPGWIEAITRLPGVRVWKKGAQAGMLDVPQHAAFIVQAALKRSEIPIVRAFAPENGLIGANRPDPEAVLDRLVASGELRPEYRQFPNAYQRDWLSFSLDPALPGALAEHCTGSGKTISLLLAGLSIPGALIVLTERKELRHQWARQIRRFTTLDPFVCRAESSLRKADRRLEDYLADSAGGRKVVVCSWEVLASWCDRLCAIPGIGAILGDEVQAVKSLKTVKAIADPDAPDEKRWEELDNRANAADRLRQHAKKVFAGSATTKFDRVRDYYRPLRWLDPDGWGSKTCWTTRYAGRKPGAYAGFDTRGATNIAELNARLSFVRHVVDQKMADAFMPAMREEAIYIPPEDQAVATGYADELKAAAKRGPSAVLEARLAAAAACAVLSMMGYLADHVNAGHKILLFTERIALAEKVFALCAKTFSKTVGMKTFLVHGERPDVANTAALDEFNGNSDAGLAPCAGPAVLVATGQKLGTGVDMPTLDVVMFLQLAWNESQLKQRRGRGRRLGGKPLLVYYFVPEGTVAEQVVSINIEKIDQGEGLTDVDRGMRAALAGTLDADKFAAAILKKLEGIDPDLLPA